VERVSCVKSQYDGYVAVDDLHVKGDLTLGENVADLGGIKLAHQAMVKWQAAHPSVADTRYSDSQQFFLGIAQAWCTKVRPEEAARRATVDPHSPPFWRVNGPLGNVDAFREAFQCSDSSKMVRAGAAHCQVW
jgi:endothelin-converting enzyme/putative endopeptidase